MSVWLRAGALVAAVMLSLSGCGGFHAGAPSTAGPCEIVPNGTPAPKTPPATVPSSRNLATNPEIATGYRRDMTVVRTAHYAAATANPLATQVACRVLRDGGTAADAVVAAQAVLGLVEPQSSGIGGGGYLVYFDARTGSVQAYDGREVAPAAATENYLRWVSDVDRSAPRPNARASGRSIGVPGILRMLEMVHNEHGRTPWRDLFGPAVTLADGGFDISARMGAAISDAASQLRDDPEARKYFLNPDGSPKPAGTRLTNPAYSKTLSAIASAGANAFYSGDIAHDIVAAASDTSNGRTPGLLTIEDLAGYLAKRRQPLCTTYRGREICGMPSSGGVAVAATLGILEHFPMSDYAPSKVDLNGGRPTVMGVHLIAEAERLAYADRDQYIADVDFVRLPGGSLTTLVDPGYLAARAALISPQHSMGSARPGDFGAPTAVAPPVPEHGTSHLSVVDSYGNAALTLMIPIGAFLGRIYDSWARWSGDDDERKKRLGVMLATGLIVGESLYGVLFAVIVATTGKEEPLAMVGDGFRFASQPLGAIVFAGLLAWLYQRTRVTASYRLAAPAGSSKPLPDLPG